VGDGLGMLVMAPIVIAASGVRGAPLRGQRVEMALLMTLFVASCVIGLSPVGVAGVAPAPYLTLPFLFWIAIRLGTLSTATATVVMAAIATWFASARTGPFAGVGMTATNVALQVYAYVAAAAVSSLFTAAAVTERRLAADALRKSEARYREVVQDQTEFIVRWLPDGRRTFVNDAYARYFAAPREALIGTSFFGLISDERARATLTARLQQLRPEQPLMTTVHLATRGDGQRRWQEWTDRAIFDEHGAVVELQSVGRDVHERIQAEHALTASEAELRQSITELRALSTRLNEVREEERARIARDVHDHLGQTLTVLKMDVAEVRRRARAGAIEAVEERLREMSSLIDGAVDDVRRVASELRPLLLDEFDLVDAIRFYLDEISHRTGLRCALAAPDAVAVPAEHAGALFRILQEALTNVTRHAAASHVRVTLRAGDRDTELIVVDDGRGLPEENERRPGALGLVGMRDRASLFGGNVVVTGGPGQGTTVTARIPVQARP
jgi:PAS domain S-box-containing protein